MTLIDNLSGFANQQTTLLLEDGTSADLSLRFHGASERWVVDIEYSGVARRNIGLCCHPNVFRQWRNLFPFGVACVTADQTDPFDINDFATGRVGLYLLNQAEVSEVESEIMGAP